MTAHPTGIVFSEIPVADIARAKTFYETLLNAPMVIDTTAGPYAKAVLAFPEGTGVFGHIVEGKPATKGEGAITHIAIPDTLEDAMDRVKRGGGEVASDIITIPAGSFFYAHDTEENTIGVFKF
ncbi:VOC family protein [Sphingomonas qilianensis]|uniref:VOC family protein n=1 Tax=Sphingomonas qilianensis TaxID=1736690 RepID=A0ABU9XMH0_9SPHN